MLYFNPAIQSLVLLFYVWMGTAISACISFRHQTVIPDGSIFKLEKVNHHSYSFSKKSMLKFPNRVQILHLISTIAVSVFYIVYALNGHDAAAMERILTNVGILHFYKTWTHKFLFTSSHYSYYYTFLGCK